MVLFLLSFSVITFSSAIYYAEVGDHGHGVGGNTFNSIPDAFWYSLVTMTTVGYGDYFPLSMCGKLVGGACAINGVMVLAMVVPIVVNNFEFFYKRDKMNSARKTEQRLKSLRKGDGERALRSLVYIPGGRTEANNNGCPPILAP